MSLRRLKCKLMHQALRGHLASPGMSQTSANSLSCGCPNNTWRRLLQKHVRATTSVTVRRTQQCKQRGPCFCQQAGLLVSEPVDRLVRESTKSSVTSPDVRLKRVLKSKGVQENTECVRLATRARCTSASRHSYHSGIGNCHSSRM
jgi:hypothetical protein